MADSSTVTRSKSKSGVRMVDVSNQPDSIRTAVASGRVVLGKDAFTAIRDGAVHKGDVLTTAQIAGIQGSKQTSHLIPLCHDVQIDGVEIEFTMQEDDYAIDVRAFTKSVGLTGVEMEALTAVSIAALTIYDMCKSIARDIYIENVRLLAKTGGQSGNWKNDSTTAPNTSIEASPEASAASVN